MRPWQWAVFGALLAFAWVASLAFFSARANAEGPPPERGCETYGCHYERTGKVVHWPGHYDPERREQWMAVAACESTHRWDYNGNSGYDGGLQFSPRTWDAYGGDEFADYAWQAWPEEQIAVAERVAFYGAVVDGVKVEPQGPRAWPHCHEGLVAP